MPKLSPTARLVNAANLLNPSIRFSDEDLEKVGLTDLKMIASILRQAETNVHQLRCQVEARIDGSRHCETCGERIAGRADRRYCSTTCRVRDHRRRCKGEDG